MISKSTNTYKTGLRAEALCRLALRLKGYSILVSRYRSKMGEIDLVAMRGNVLAIIEVKARDTITNASEAVSPRQQARLTRAAQAFLSRNPRFNQHTIRFDVMLVIPWRWPMHIAGAWDG